MIHVMPITSIARITKMDIERLEQLSQSNPVFAAGVDFFYKLGGVQEVVEQLEDMREVVLRHIDEVYACLLYTSCGRRSQARHHGEHLHGVARFLKDRGRPAGALDCCCDVRRFSRLSYDESPTGGLGRHAYLRRSESGIFAKITLDKMRGGRL